MNALAVALLVASTHPVPNQEDGMRSIGVGFLAVAMVGCGTFDFEPGSFEAAGGPRDGDVLEVTTDQDVIDALTPWNDCDAPDVEETSERVYALSYRCTTTDRTLRIRITPMGGCFVADSERYSASLTPVTLRGGVVVERAACGFP